MTVTKNSATPASKKPRSLKNILPPAPREAVHSLARLSRNLIDLAQRECQALVQQDMLSFAIMQNEKDRMADDYRFASQEFRSRIEEFRGIEKSALQELETLQQRLADHWRSNNVIIENMRTRARQSTQSTLLSVQELAQRHPVMIEAAAQNQDNLSGR